jgi:hypothetical protein
MNEYESSTPSGERSERYRDDAWRQTYEWVHKVEAAYNQYVARRSSFERSTILYILAFGVCAVIAPLSGNFFQDSTAAAKSIGLGVGALVAAVAFFDVLKRFQTVTQLRRDLRDLYSISNELFQMMISTEEQGTANRFEYLVSHIRILEIKHLLQKVEKVISSGLRFD